MDRYESRETPAAISSQLAKARYAPPGANAAVGSKRIRALPERRAVSTVVPTPIPGPYAGQTDELSPSRISFSYLGGALHDLKVGGKPIVSWIPVRAGGAGAQLADADVRVVWDSDRQAHGSITRRRGDRIETLEFHARQRFRE